MCFPHDLGHVCAIARAVDRRRRPVGVVLSAGRGAEVCDVIPAYPLHAAHRPRPLPALCHAARRRRPRRAALQHEPWGVHVAGDAGDLVDCSGPARRRPTA
eukprot:4297224-Prymnesium_polylepis.1